MNGSAKDIMIGISLVDFSWVIASSWVIEKY